MPPCQSHDYACGRLHIAHRTFLPTTEQVYRHSCLLSEGKATVGCRSVGRPAGSTERRPSTSNVSSPSLVLRLRATRAGKQSKGWQQRGHVVGHAFVLLREQAACPSRESTGHSSCVWLPVRTGGGLGQVRALGVRRHQTPYLPWPTCPSARYSN